MRTIILGIAILVLGAHILFAQQVKQSFGFAGREFLLNGKPFQMISGEIHPARVPAEYWRHRIQMAKAMGCNTIAAYIFWNYHETAPGIYDFSTGNKDITRFVRIAQEEGMWVVLRPGPYVCAEWDFGGIPVYLLRYPDLKVRCMDERYMSAVIAYLKALSLVVKPLQVTEGGPVLMLQVENEYGSYGNDRAYLKAIEKTWRECGITVPFFTGDGPTTYMLEAGSLPGCAVGLDSGYDQGCFDLAYKMNPGVPVFSSETYPGWLTHWGEAWARPDTTPLLRELRFLMDRRYSFNLYVIHGGTNFGFTAGANSGGNGYEPDVTSYDYDAPINEQGLPTYKYFAIRNLMESYLPKGRKLPPVPAPVPTMEIPEIKMERFTSVWNNLPEPLNEVQPRPFEYYGQNQGLMLYRTRLIGHKGGTLKVTELHDYATVFLDGVYLGALDRRVGISSITLPQSVSDLPVLDILVEGMGHINFGQEIIDRKGITDRVTLNGMTLMNWEIFPIPMDKGYVESRVRTEPATARPGIFFKGTFDLTRTGDTYIDIRGYEKGVVWINGHNLGRYWNLGPQYCLYCPASWLRLGTNELVVFDMHHLLPEVITGRSSPEGR